MKTARNGQSSLFDDHGERATEDAVSISEVGGAHVITEAMPNLRSVAVGFWVGSGAVDETEGELGASHFLEHLLFKGTEDRSASDIAAAIESVGGDMNAFTTQEYTAFYVRVPDDHLDLALDILADVVWRPAFRIDEVESERRVILEEIGMRDDAPDDVVHELANAALFPDHPLGRSVLGTRESIGSMSRAAIVDYHGAHYKPSNVVIAAAGNLDHDRVAQQLASRVPSDRGSRPARGVFPLAPSESTTGEHRTTEQAHLVLAMRSIARDDPDRYALSVVNQLLGGGMSSRLFQEVREQRGLAYSVYAYRAAYETVGSMAIYAGTAPERLSETLHVIRDELAKLVIDGVSEAELVSAKGHLKGSTTLALETSSSRMHRLGRGLLTLGEVPTVDDIVAAVDAVTLTDLRRTIDRVFATDDLVLSVVGPVHAADLIADLAA
ncbi:MAG: pitrilysin family protein [Acidimicrobiia bacterium]